MSNTRRVVRAQLRKKKRTIRKSKRNKGPSNKKRGGMRRTTRGTGARKTVRSFGLKPEAVVAEYNKQVRELIKKYNAKPGNPQIVLPDVSRPIGYAFSSNCDAYYYIVLGYYFKTNGDHKFELGGYMVMQNNRLDAPGTQVTPEALAQPYCSLEQKDYNDLVNLRLPPDAENLPHIIFLKPRQQ